MTSFAKDTDGFMARHFDRKISGAISRQLLKTSITPNKITLAVTLLGIGAGVCMAQTGYWPKLSGAVLFLVTSILDGCDGEVARAKKMISKLGGWLDLWGDNVVHIAVFYGLGFGLYEDSGQRIYLTLGVIAAIGTLLSASIASYQTYRKLKNPSPPPSPLEGAREQKVPPRPLGGEVAYGDSQEGGGSLFTSVVGDAANVHSAWQARLVRWSDALARRDFIYGVVILALIGHLEWFLWACAGGVCVYTAVLLALLLVSL